MPAGPAWLGGDAGAVGIVGLRWLCQPHRGVGGQDAATWLGPAGTGPGDLPWWLLPSGGAARGYHWQQLVKSRGHLQAS